MNRGGSASTVARVARCALRSELAMLVQLKMDDIVDLHIFERPDHRYLEANRFLTLVVPGFERMAPRTDDRQGRFLPHVPRRPHDGVFVVLRFNPVFDDVVQR